MRIVINIPDAYYKSLQDISDEALLMQDQIIKYGTPLKDIELQIDKQSEMHSDGEIYITNFNVHRILRADKEVKADES